MDESDTIQVGFEILPTCDEITEGTAAPDTPLSAHSQSSTSCSPGEMPANPVRCPAGSSQFADRKKLPKAVTSKGKGMSDGDMDVSPSSQIGTRHPRLEQRVTENKKWMSSLTKGTYGDLSMLYD